MSGIAMATVLGAVFGSLAVVGDVGAQEQRVLTVEQTSIQAVQPPTAGAGANPLTVTAWVDRTDNTYAQGERVRIYVQTNKDAWVTVLNVAPQGQITVLLPNRYQADNRVRANVATEVPASGRGAQLRVQAASGAELIKVFASSRPDALFNAAQLEAGGTFPRVLARARQTARVLQVEMEGQDGADWAVYDKVIRTVPRRVPVAVGSAPVVSMPVGAAPAQPFGLEVAADRALYRLSDAVTLLVKTERDCHLSLLNSGSGGRSRLLFPNRYQQNTLIRKGQTVVVPGLGAGFHIRPLGPVGVEHVVAVCRPGSRALLSASGEILRRSGGFVEFEEVAGSARTLEVVADEPGKETAVSSTSFVVVP